MTPATAARLLTDDRTLHPRIARLLGHLVGDETLLVLDRIEEYRCALRPREGEHPLERAVQVAVDSIGGGGR